MVAKLVLAVLLALAAGVPPAAAASPECLRANEEGAAHFRAGRHEEAVAAFRSALAADPSSQPVRRNLAAALATLGNRLMGTGGLDRARLMIEEAAELDPGDARYPFLLGTLLFMRGDLYDARRRVDRALELDPALAAARELSGDLHYREGALDRARREWESALPAAGPRASALRAKLERAGREADAEPGFGRDVSRHFTIQYDGPVPGEVARGALRLLEAAYDRLGAEFGRAPLHDIPVLLYAGERFLTFNPEAPRWAGGTYDGKIRVPVGGLGSAADAERLGPILAHELAHAFIHASVPGQLPRWFEEGIAQRFGGGSAERARAAVLAAPGAFVSLAAVETALRGGPHVSAAYGASFLAVEELVRMDGFWLPRRILELVAGGSPFPEAFRRAAGLDLAAFEERWAARLR